MRSDLKRTTRVRGTTTEIDQRARELRHTPTPAEALLWARLRRHQLSGYKFRRQHPLGRFIADFCCPACRLIVELDGPIHRQQIQQDAERTRQFEAFGYRILRFTNEQVLHDIDAVLSEIAAACQT